MRPDMKALEVHLISEQRRVEIVLIWLGLTLPQMLAVQIARCAYYVLIGLLSLASNVWKSCAPDSAEACNAAIAC